MTKRLQVIDGYFDDNTFYMRSIAGFPLEGRFKAAGLRSLARLIDENEPFSFIMGQNTMIHVPVVLNRQLKQELFMIVEKLEAEKE
ncbi:hypothetical protein AB4J90_18925 [Geobacillus thermodenitrificans]|jgi:hypothetical protein|uniref:Uncharacterized protein n=1 Tax=Geobacillus thermodenitrificans TaxID=33940 RepID=A0ABY9QBG8_GEOTD|nr:MULTISPECIES: hypothetical protein [Geobacillus]ARP44490.1 hypothetical protein GTHT12_02996 [Geobacillus thermodenitrificans]OQP07056.1 hypothetical protein B1691_16890 [Geobacillus sp. 47C-IIb]QNU29841.1 hypothetical protein IC804_09560 [Geobacillus sp. 47C-IIb]WMV76253.1 hypothetical protein HSX42_19025 [Geobacillus thermodenitrificans]